MIRVRVLLPPGWKGERLDERYWMELEEGATLATALKAVNMPRPLAKAFFVSVNGAHVPTTEKLKDGDSIAFFPLASGG